MRQHLSSFIIILVLVFLMGCGQSKPVETEDFVLGTIVNQQVYGVEAKKASQEASRRMKELHELWDINNPDGDIGKLNSSAGQGYVELDPATIAVLMEADKISELSGGDAFDITVGPLVKSWGIGTEEPKIPSDDVITELLALVDYKDVIIDRATGSAALRKAGQTVDLGGIAKGYIGDLVAGIYRNHGITSAFANLGGNVVALGSKPDGSPWKVGIQDPRGPTGEIMGIVEVADQAVVTSGDYQQYFIADGNRYCHIIDPRRGYPIDSGLMSVTIIASSSSDADGLAKAMVLGLDRGMELVHRYGRAQAIFITTDKRVYITPGLQDKFHLEGVKNGYTLVQNR